MRCLKKSGRDGGLDVRKLTQLNVRADDRHLSQIKAGPRGRLTKAGMWQPIRTAPFDTEIELAVIDRDGPHGLVFPCRRALRGWIKAETGESIAVRPTHWKPWKRLEAETGATPR